MLSGGMTMIPNIQISEFLHDAGVNNLMVAERVMANFYAHFSSFTLNVWQKEQFRFDPRPDYECLNAAGRHDP